MNMLSAGEKLYLFTMQYLQVMLLFCIVIINNQNKTK